MKPKFGILTLLAMTFIIAFCLSKYDHFHPIDGEVIGLPQNSGSALIAYGIREHKRHPKLNRLEFAILVVSNDPISDASISNMPNSKFKSAILRVGDIEIKVPSDSQLHEVVDGKHRTSSEKIDQDSLFQYFAAGHTKHSLQKIVELAKQPKD